MKSPSTIQELRELVDAREVDPELDFYARKLAKAMSSPDWTDDFDAFDKMYEDTYRNIFTF